LSPIQKRKGRRGDRTKPTRGRGRKGKEEGGRKRGGTIRPGRSNRHKARIAAGMFLSQPGMEILAS